MGYHATILRTNNGKSDPISKKEIEEVISSDESYSFDGDVLSRNRSFFLKFTDGTLWLTNPEDSDLEVMILLAKDMNARIRGDELDTYSDDGNTYIHPDDKALRAEARASVKELLEASKNRNTVIYFTVMSCFFVAAILVSVFSK